MTDRRPWNNSEDQIIVRLVNEFGSKKWTEIAHEMAKVYSGPTRSSKQIRERWYNHLSPQINKSVWTEQEENIIFEAHKRMGSKWKDIAKLLQGRTDNFVKNHFYSSLRRSLRRINKYLGQKNSTEQMRMLKPSVLSKLIEEGSKDQQMRVLLNGIYHFSKCKPNKPKQNTDSVLIEQKNQYQQAIHNLIELNQKFGNKVRDTRKSKNKNMATTEHPAKLDESRSAPTSTFNEDLTRSEDFAAKQENKAVQKQMVNFCIEDNMEVESVKPDWSESSPQWAINFPEYDRPEEDNLLMLVNNQQEYLN